MFEHSPQISWTFIPYDFVLDKNKLSASELETRFEKHGREIFYKDMNVGAAGASTVLTAAKPVAGTAVSDSDKVRPLKDFESRCRNLRNALHDIGHIRLMATFGVRSAVLKHSFGELVTLDDFLLEYRTGVYNNEKRWLVSALCHGMWGTECFGTIEKLIMDKLKLKYSNKLVGDITPKTRRSHGSIKGMITRMKQTYICERFR